MPLAFGAGSGAVWQRLRYYHQLAMQAHRGPDDDPPTVRPPFDPAKFARDSERALRAQDAVDSARPTQPPPPAPPSSERSAESAQLLVNLSIESDDVPYLAVARDALPGLQLSLLARMFLRFVNERDCVAVICSRSGLGMDDAVLALEELSGAGVVSFQRTTR
jgi:hypothetical protein